MIDGSLIFWSSLAAALTAGAVLGGCIVLSNLSFRRRSDDERPDSWRDRHG